MKLMAAFLVSLSLFVVPAFAGKKHSHHHQKAHVHGQAKIAAAFDGLKGELILEGSGDSLVGFEHKPKNMQQEKKLKAAETQLREKAQELMVFPEGLKCEVNAKSFDLHYEGNHSDFKVVYDLSCDKKIAGKMKLLFPQFFPKMKKIEVELLSESGGKNLTLTSKNMEIEI